MSHATVPAHAAIDLKAQVAAASVGLVAPTVEGGLPHALRRGLPRVPNGERWPPIAVLAGHTLSHTAPSCEAEQAAASMATVGGWPSAMPEEMTRSPARAGIPIRRGLPRVPAGGPWPPAGAAPAPITSIVADGGAPSTPDSPTLIPKAPPVASMAPLVPATATAVSGVPSSARTATGVPLSQPLPFRRTVWPGRTASSRPVTASEPERIGPFTKPQWVGAGFVAGGGLLFASALAVAFVRWFLSLEFIQDFIATYPGEYHLPEGAPVGFPGWLAWQHFFNVFLMVLIIRSGLRVRTEKRPSAYWTPRGRAMEKVSLTVWFHQSLDLLWLANGVVFVVLLFVTGQWMRVIPTSWEVLPNAVSAALQYVSLDWPTENGWVNYNSLQQIAYFTTIFVAAPLAAATGFRMSGLWPKRNQKLSRAYPIEWARAAHFPVMLYFVAFIAIHVFLVFATGALRNLNHMYAAQGSVDPDAYADNWVGFWFFVASLAVIAVAWVAARPLVLAPIARLFGTVSGR